MNEQPGPRNSQEEQEPKLAVFGGHVLTTMRSFLVDSKPVFYFYMRVDFDSPNGPKRNVILSFRPDSYMFDSIEPGREVIIIGIEKRGKSNVRHGVKKWIKAEEVRFPEPPQQDIPGIPPTE